jgi:dTDP-4-amino-4,6-dideoxygalactose transaminase
MAEVVAYYRERGEDYGYQGHFERLYIDAFTRYHGGGYADGVATGTAALYIGLAALELPRGSQVLVSPVTDPGTLSAIVLNGLVPRLADTMHDTFNIGPDQVASRLTDSCSAVLVVHAAGSAAPIEEISVIARERNVRVLEDCSQSHGARTVHGNLIGTIGDIAAFSTMYRKAHITGGSGGIVYSRNEAIAHLALAHADRGKPRWAKDFDDRNPCGFLFPALNFHTDEISCAIGIASLERLPETIEKRLAYKRGLEEGLASSEVLRVPPTLAGDSPFIIPVSVDATLIECSKTEFANAVLAEGIPLNPHYQYLTADWPWLRQYLADDFEPAQARARRDSIFNLYVNENYGEQEVHDTLAALRKVESFYRKG